MTSLVLCYSGTGTGKGAGRTEIYLTRDMLMKWGVWVDLGDLDIGCLADCFPVSEWRMVMDNMWSQRTPV